MGLTTYSLRAAFLVHVEQQCEKTFLFVFKFIRLTEEVRTVTIDTVAVVATTHIQIDVIWLSVQYRKNTSWTLMTSEHVLLYFRFWHSNLVRKFFHKRYAMHSIMNVCIFALLDFALLATKFLQLSQLSTP